MIWLAGLLAYAAVASVAARLVAGHLAWSFAQARTWSRPNGDQWFGAWFLALCLAAVWPLAVVWFVVGRRFSVGAEREQKLREREQRVKEIERELELG